MTTWGPRGAITPHRGCGGAVGGIANRIQGENTNKCIEGLFKIVSFYLVFK